MRAIGLWQPWGEWLINGDKLIETRPRPMRTLVGQRVAIHATLREPMEARAAAITAAYEARLPLPDLDKLPHGALIGTVFVDECFQMTATYVRYVREHWPREFALGDYAEGRWAFTLKDPMPFSWPVPWRGKQGVFMVPDELLHEHHDCTCRVTTDPRCVFHGVHGTMVSQVALTGLS